MWWGTSVSHLFYKVNGWYTFRILQKWVAYVDTFTHFRNTMIYANSSLDLMPEAGHQAHGSAGADFSTETALSGFYTFSGGADSCPFICLVKTVSVTCLRIAQHLWGLLPRSEVALLCLIVVTHHGRTGHCRCLPNQLVVQRFFFSFILGAGDWSQEFANTQYVVYPATAPNLVPCQW